VARGSDGVEALVRELRGGGAEVVGIAADCSRATELERVRAEVESTLGAADILLPFAGGFSNQTPILDLDEEEWRDIVDWNLTSTFLTVRAFLPGMAERQHGAIVTMASNAGRLLDTTLNAAYAAAKAGIVMFTRHVAMEMGARNVRVNCVAPATTLTERVERIMTDERRETIAAMTPLGRLGMPADTAHAALYLCSDAAGWITGVTIDVAGGRIML
jgi:3-oxoacyl-[acyl-carrier protein] reductase